MLPLSCVSPSLPMLNIRHEQSAVFEQASQIDFEDRMVVHLKSFFPKHSSALGDEKMRQLIQFGIQRAGTHAFVNERDVCKFIDLMIVFDPGFDQDPACDWAGEILGDPTLTSPPEKMDRLYDRGQAIVDARAASED